MKIAPLSPLPEASEDQGLYFKNKKSYSFGAKDEFIVLSIYVSGQGISYRIFAEGQNNPSIYPAVLFKVVSSRIPSSWVIEVSDDGKFVSFEPEPWTKPGFWEEFFDRDPAARKIFEQESYKIVAEET